MKIKVFGYRGNFGIAERFEAVFKYLNHEISDEPDLIYHCNGFFDDAEEFYVKLEKKPKRIYTLLDIDPEKDKSQYSEAIKHLNNADAVCAISNLVKEQMINAGVTKDINVIGFPTRPVLDKGRKTEERKVDILYVGRLYSKSKRFSILGEIIQDSLDGKNNKQIVVAGGEPIQYQNFIYSPSDQNLNILYSHSKFVINTSSFEGLGLTPIEGVICGCFPIVMNDNKVIKELGLEAFSCDPTPAAILAKMEEIEKNVYFYEAIRSGLAKEYNEKFNILSIAKKVLEIYGKT